MTRRFLLSAAAFCVLLLRPLRSSWIIAPAVTVAICLFAASEMNKKKIRPKHGTAAAASLISGFAALVFAAVWLRSMRTVSLHFFDWKSSMPVLISAVVCAPCAVPFLSRVLTAVMNTEEAESRELKSEAEINRRDRVLLLSTAAAAVTVVSLCSPIYPFNDWVDANCFFTVGKSMLSGLVPYRDLYEQKGPLLYALYSLAYPLSHTGFLGVWLMEIAAAYFFLRLSYGVFLLLYGKKSPAFVLLTAALVYTAPAFLKGGSAEEFSLPLVMTAMYFGLRSLKTERDLSFRECLVIGLTSGAVFWIKYSMLGFYLGFIILPAWRILRKKEAGKLLQSLLVIILGVLIISVPVLAYFAYHGALASLWEVYFYNNLFVYGKGGSALSTIKSLLSGAASMLTWNDSTLLLTVFGAAMLVRRKEKSLALYVLLTFTFAFVMIYAGGINLKYYSEILCIFVPVGLSELWIAFSGAERTGAARAEDASEEKPTGECSISGLHALRAFRRQGERWKRIVVPLLFVLALFGSDNIGMLKTNRRDLPQYRFASVIAETPNATLFNYGALDIGQYTVSDIIPSCRYFCMLNLPSEEMFREMEHYMADGVTDYIVSRGLEVDSPCYELVDSVSFPNEGTEYPYYLYKRKESP